MCLKSSWIAKKYESSVKICVDLIKGVWNTSQQFSGRAKESRSFTTHVFARLKGAAFLLPEGALPESAIAAWKLLKGSPKKGSSMSKIFTPMLGIRRSLYFLSAFALAVFVLSPLSATDNHRHHYRHGGRSLQQRDPRGASHDHERIHWGRPARRHHGEPATSASRLCCLPHIRFRWKRPGSKRTEAVETF